MKHRENQSIALVIFGVTGDLTRRKLIPALYQLALEGRFPARLFIFGFARRDWNDEALRDHMRGSIHEFARTKPVDEAILEDFLSRAAYVRSEFEDPDGYHRLRQVLDEKGLVNRLFYLATPPDEYPVIIRQAGQAGLEKHPGGWTRIVIEKPYGRDYESANALDDAVHRVFDESQLYRIDHYLGKETVQNILVFRFANGIFEPLWNRHFVDYIEITVAETVGVGSRAGYYEKAGVIRDIFQNHILQLVALTAMEAPVAFNADAVRNEKVKVLSSLRPIRGADTMVNTIRAQYGAGRINGKEVPGYKEEAGVSPASTTETLLAACLHIDNWRWADIPIFIRSGKRLAKRVTKITIQFKQVPLPLFGWRNLAGDAPNMLILNIQPDEGITLTFGAKAPGQMNQITPVQMEFDYSETFGSEPPESYERLLLDAMIGDATLFIRSDEILASWAFTTEILKGWAEHPVDRLPVYEAGSWGPPEMFDFIHEQGSPWWTFH